ncbi:MAG: three-Cys-motif partner protein TcmP [Gaiellaceae bacterium]
MPAGNAKRFFGRIRPWQWIKHSVFTQYLVVWAAKVGSPPHAKTIWVIDAFAGAGGFTDVVTGETAEGSPVRAALVARDYNERSDKKAAGKQLRLICIERDPEHYEALKKRLQSFSFAEVLPGEFSEHADQIISMIGNDPALILLDPIGVKSIDAATCKKLLHRPGKTDAFVNVQFAYVHRTRGQMLDDGEPNPEVPGSAANVENIDRFFGTKAWRQIAVNGKPSKEQEAEYLALYFESVVGSGFSCKHAYPVSASYGGKPKYYLVHLADHPHADWLINDLLASVQSRLYIVSCQRERPDALTGFFEDEDRQRIEGLRKALGEATVKRLKAEPTHTMRYGQLCLALRPEFFGKLKEGDYSKAVKALLAEGRVLREQSGVRAKLLPDELISLPVDD